MERAEFETKARYTNQIDYMEKQVAMLQKKLEMAEDDKNNKVQALEVSSLSSFSEKNLVLACCDVNVVCAKEQPSASDDICGVHRQSWPQSKRS